jgi:transcriptional antiterminator RfaH
MTTASAQHWCVVQTHPHAEAKAAFHIARQGFGTYLPRYLKRRRHARKVETVAAPLFPRYLFVLIDLAAQPWRCVQSTVGVSHLVLNGDVPATLPERVLEELKRREDERGFIQLVKPVPFVRGDAVRILDGVFSACVGLFDSRTDRERVTVLLDLLGRKVRVVMDLESVAAA